MTITLPDVDPATSPGVEPDAVPSGAGETPPPTAPRVPAPTGRARRRPKLPVQPRTRRALAPRGGSWWLGAAFVVIAALCFGFVLHVALLSSMQHARAQTLSYEQLRTTMAKADIPVGQLTNDERMTPIGTPVALLSIPSLGLEEVVAEGSTAQQLRAGPGHRRDSVFPGQAGTSVIMARQAAYGGPFQGLHKLVPGDTIAISTGQGEHEYTVFALRREGEALPEPAGRGQGRLELITADGLPLMPDGTLHVHATLTSTVQTTPTRVMSYPALPEAERAMSDDPGAWFAAIVWLVALSLAGALLVWLWRVWARWHTWVIGVPIVLALGLTAADAIMNALPNLL